MNRGNLKTCSCGATIFWIRTSIKAMMPIEEDAPYIVIVTDNGQVVRGRESHFATCPDADKHRRRRVGS